MYAHWVCISVGVLVHGGLQNILEEKHMVPENEEATYVYQGGLHLMYTVHCTLYIVHSKRMWNREIV